jgi:poly-gamma-glutamate capsule biosynthesis protein CapA/YwtB (metallophosphatase superfamily)
MLPIGRGTPALLVAASLIVVSLLAGSAATAGAHDPQHPRGRLVIHGTGDVSFSPDLMGRFSRGGYEEAWDRLGGIFQRDHLTIINLECTPSRLGSPIEKEWNLRCDPDSLPAMAAAGVDVASLANNHAGDFGHGALVDGVDRVREADIEPVGAGRNLEEANRPAFFDIEGWRVAVVGLNTVSGRMIGEGGGGWFAGPNAPGTAPASSANIEAAVSAAAAVADIVIVTVHWGEEGSPTPHSGDRLRARAMIDAGATVILGHHAHRLQPLEVIDGVPVFWGLGNFVWPRMSTIEATTGIAEIVIEPDGTVHARLIPAFIEMHGQPVLRGQPDWTLRDDRSRMR